MAFTEEIEIMRKEDYMQFLPIELPEEFTTKDLAKTARIHVSLARVVMNILFYVGTVDKIGKKGNNIIYKVNINN